MIAGPESRDMVERVEQFCRRHGLTFNDPDMISESLADTGESFASAVSRASLLVACLSNTQIDSSVHFASGMVCARPKAGIARSKLDRRVLLLVPEGQQQDGLIADSASRVTRTVKVVAEKDINSSLSRFAANRERWQEKQKGTDAD